MYLVNYSLLPNGQQCLVVFYYSAGAHFPLAGMFCRLYANFKGGKMTSKMRSSLIYKLLTLLSQLVLALTGTEENPRKWKNLNLGGGIRGDQGRTSSIWLLFGGQEPYWFYASYLRLFAASLLTEVKTWIKRRYLCWKVLARRSVIVSVFVKTLGCRDFASFFQKMVGLNKSQPPALKALFITICLLIILIPQSPSLKLYV